MTIYIDVLFAKEFLINFIILITVGKIVNQKADAWKLLLSSVLGGLSTIVCLIVPTTLIEVIRIISVFAIVTIAYQPENLMDWIKTFITFYIITFMIAGIGFYTYGEELKNVLYVIATVTFLFEWIKSYKEKYRINHYIYDLEIEIKDRKYQISTFLDTGNELTSAFEEDVIVVSPKTIKRMEDEELTNILINQDISHLTDWQENIRTIPFSSLGNPNAVRYGVKVQNTFLTYEDKTISKPAVIIASDSNFRFYDSIIGLHYLETFSKKEVLDWKS
ncbi:MAG: sigma-E processing peptidase SpoIIGA [Clostridia bacterium]|nr:sigma-E processing peptidase SpoIIGA [Clostridia bacterium]